jgi:ribonuclease R
VNDESHQIIEEFMLAANIAVATKLTNLGVKFLRRVHGSPDAIKLKGFAEFVESLGFPLRRYHDRHQLQSLLDEVRGQPVEQAINYALLRSMRQAEYTGEEDGHYALAIENYCHFTSPIRRYPDLTVHRLIDAVIRRDDGRKKIGFRATDINKLGQHCSLTERRAAEAERQLIRVKLLRLLVTRKDETFAAIITGVEKFGIFARCVALPVDGIIPIEKLQQTELLEYDRATRRLFSKRSGVAYQLGDELQVKIERIDPDARQLEWRLMSPPGKRPNLKSNQKKERSFGSKAKRGEKPTARPRQKTKVKSKTKSRK